MKKKASITELEGALRLSDEQREAQAFERALRDVVADVLERQGATFKRLADEVRSKPLKP